MTIQVGRLSSAPTGLLALAAAVALAFGVACGGTAPVAGAGQEVARQQAAQPGAAGAPAGNASSPGGTIHWLGPATASVALEEYGDFQ